MTGTSDEEADEPISLDDAFGVLGNETRLDILQALAEANNALSFTEFRQRTGYDDPGDFEYHLNQLAGHFVRKTEAGYALRAPGNRVVQAVLSGVVSADPVRARTRIDDVCTYCQALIEVSYQQERLSAFCTTCPGAYRKSLTDIPPSELDGFLGFLRFPPAGIRDRSLEEAYRAAQTWGHLEMLGIASGVCPRCAATMDCATHESTDAICEHCRRRHAIQIEIACTTCTLGSEGLFVNGLVAHTEVLAFLLDHGIDLVQPDRNPWAKFDFDEELLSADPIETRFTFTVGDDARRLTVDDSLEVIATS